MLSPFQEHIARLFLSLPTSEDFALGGGAALVFKRAVPRRTDDLDFFAVAAEQVRPAVDGFIEALKEASTPFEVVRSVPGYARLTVGQDDESTVVDVVYDYRLDEPEPSPLGPIITTRELAANKLLALFGRAAARDFVDVFLLAQVYDIDEIIEWARLKDLGLDEYFLAEMIDRLRHIDRRELEVDDPTYESLCAFFGELQAALVERALRGPECPEGS